MADLALFDPATVVDHATWEQPAALATGVEHVLIGGGFAIERGRPANLRLGRVSPRSRPARGAPSRRGSLRNECQRGQP